MHDENDYDVSVVNILTDFMLISIMVFLFYRFYYKMDAYVLIKILTAIILLRICLFLLLKDKFIKTYETSHLIFLLIPAFYGYFISHDLSGFQTYTVTIITVFIFLKPLKNIGRKKKPD